MAHIKSSTHSRCHWAENRLDRDVYTVWEYFDFALFAPKNREALFRKVGHNKADERNDI